MRDQTVTFRFMPDDKVKAHQFGIDGIIQTCSIVRKNGGGTEIRYGVEWVNPDNNINFRWFDEDQLEAIQ